ncbi:GNAT family N-acetyltransferase [Staphylococcus capitis]|uniref:GNAT family N-acetyltransferase n=1 Tax=Staphylococcus capitis TaxID=29388 RepID=UPI003D0829EC
MGVSTLNTFTIRQAGTDEFETVFELLAEGVNWLRSRGLDQWSTWEKWRTKMRPSLERGDVWFLCHGDTLIGTVTVEIDGDTDFWTPDELAEPAGYVSKLYVRRARAGDELGRLLLEWAGDHAYRFGCNWLRLDAWKSNPDLHAYYRDRGWTYLRTVDVPGRHSGALFQTLAQPLGGPMRSRLSEIPQIPTLDAPMSVPGDSVDTAGNWRPGHTHQVPEFTVEYPQLGPRPLLVVPGYRYRLRFTENRWLLDSGQPGSGWQEAGRVTQTSRQLDADAKYVLTHDDRKPCSVRIAAVKPGQSLAITSLPPEPGVPT